MRQVASSEGVPYISRLEDLGSVVSPPAGFGVKPQLETRFFHILKATGRSFGGKAESWGHLLPALT